MAQITGRVFMTLGSQRIRSKEGASLDFGGTSKESVSSDSGVDGYSSKTVAPKVSFKVSHTAETKVKDLQDFVGKLLFETDTGRVYTLPEAWCTESPKLEKGEVSLEFSGTECLED